MLWVDKHRPTSLDGLNYHHDLSSRLARLAGSGDLPHLLFHGPSGSGKKTRIMALLREIYGPGTDKLRLEHRSFKTPTKKTIELTTIASNYHIEMNPGDAGNNDRCGRGRARALLPAAPRTHSRRPPADNRFVVQDVIKEIAQTASLTATSQVRCGAVRCARGGALSPPPRKTTSPRPPPATPHRAPPARSRWCCSWRWTG